MTKIIRAENRHIFDGKAQNCNRCPIALALLEVTGLPFKVLENRILISRNEFFDYADIKTIPLPYSARYFVTDFDGGSKVYPFEFAIEWPFD